MSISALTRLFALTALLIGFMTSSCGDSTTEDASGTNTASSTTEAPTANSGDEPNTAASETPNKPARQTTPTVRSRNPEPKIDIDSERAFARLEAIVDLTDAQRTEIREIYEALSLPEEASALEIQARNRQLRQQVYTNVLTPSQQQEIRAARRSRTNSGD